MPLTRTQIRTWYDRFGRRQDTQAFYEDPALDVLVRHGGFASAHRVFEFGCGTGRFAARLLSRHLPPGAIYRADDLSPRMVALAAERLAGYRDRAEVLQAEGELRFPLADASVDRVVATYVLDLLGDDDILRFLDEASRVLRPGGKLCLTSLTRGTTLVSRCVSGVWNAVFTLNAALVGGCRPLLLAQRLAADTWELDHREIVVARGVPSEVLVAGLRATDTAAPDTVAIVG